MGKGSGSGWKKFTDGLASFVAPEVSDSIIQQNTQQIQSINDQMEQLADSFRSKVQAYLKTVKDLHDRQLQMDAILWTPATVKSSGFILPKLDTFDTKGYDITIDVIKVVAPALSMALTVVPDGMIFGMIVPMIGDGIVAAVQTGESDDALSNAQSNLSKLQSAINTNNTKLSANKLTIKTLNAELDSFQQQVFSSLKVTSWKQILDLQGNTLRFSVDITQLGSIQTQDEANKISQNLSDSTERQTFLNLFAGKQNLINHINQIKGVSVAAASPPPTASRSLNLSVRTLNLASSDVHSTRAFAPAPAPAQDSSNKVETTSKPNPTLEQYVLQSAKNKLYTILAHHKTLFRSQFNLLFAAHLGIASAGDGKLQYFYTALRNEVTKSLDESSRCHASVLRNLSIFDTDKDWSAHTQVSSPPLQKGNNNTHGITIPNFLDGIYPYESERGGGDEAINNPYDWLIWKKSELQNCASELTRIENSFKELRSGAMLDMFGHEEEWKKLGKPCEEAFAALSYFNTVESAKSDGEAGEVIRKVIFDDDGMNELLALANLRDFYDAEMSRIHLTEMKN